MANPAPSLAELQRRFADNLLAARAEIPPEILSAGISPVQRFAVYRNNVSLGLADSLAAAFPAAARILGRDFADLADAFLRAHPPEKPQLLAWGGGFPAFAAEHRAAKKRPWLADLLRLEWARDEAYFAADAKRLDGQALASLPPEKLGDVRFVPMPSLRLIASPQPIYSIWSGAKAPAGPEQAMPEQLMIVRPEQDVLIVPLPPTDFAFAQALAAGRTLAQAAEAAPETLDLQTALATMLVHGAFCGLV